MNRRQKNIPYKYYTQWNNLIELNNIEAEEKKNKVKWSVRKWTKIMRTKQVYFL